MTNIHLRRFADRAELEAALAERLLKALTAADKSLKAVMLSGGSTPLPVYRKLAAAKPRAPEGMAVLFSDDRYVPSSSDASNYHQSLPLLHELALPEDRLLRVRTELSLAEAAIDYAWRLAQLDISGAKIGLGLLGLGADGHTASLFTPADIERSRGRLAISVQRPDGLGAVSVTPKWLTKVAEPLFVVAGKDKQEALAKLLAHDSSIAATLAIADCGSVEVWAESSALR